MGVIVKVQGGGVRNSDEKRYGKKHSVTVKVEGGSGGEAPRNFGVILRGNRYRGGQKF